MTRHLVLAALAASCLVTPAAAQTISRTVVVHHADLDLSRPRDIARLDRRIARAAAAACGPTSSLDPAGKNAAIRCARRTAAQARGQRDYVIARFGRVQQARAF